MAIKFQIQSRTRTSMRLAALLLTAAVPAAMVPAAMVAQQAPAPKVEIFGGYSAYFPGATASGLLPLGVTPIASCLCWNHRGAGVGATYDFNRWLGLTVDGSDHWGDGATTAAGRLGHFSAYNISVGPKFTLRRGHFAPFAEVLVGEDSLTPELFARDNRFGLLAGGGLDLRFGRHFAIRPVQADFVYSNHQFGAQPLVPATDVRGLRLQAGIVFLFGGHTAPIVAPPMQPTPTAAPAAIPAPQPVDELTLALSASPSTISPGDTSVIAATATSSLNRPLTYSYRATAGVVNGTGSTAMLTTEGVAAGAIVVTGNVVDDMGNTATGTTTVNVVVAAASPVIAAETHPLGSISFERDARRPTRVDNEAKAFLDEVTLTLQHDVDAKLALVGSAGSHEPRGSELAAQRAVNTKAYLVGEKGIDASRISVYTGSDVGKKVSFILVPSGAALDTSSLTAVDEHVVKARPRASAHSRRK
jgi:hypothetical protein